MASINGISLKKQTTFRGHEGEPCFQGDMYLGKKKIAFWSQDSWGAIMDNLDMEEGFSEQKLRNQIAALNKDKTIKNVSQTGQPYEIKYDVEQLMTDLLSLRDDEKLFKKAVKAGYKMIVVLTDGYHLTYWSLDASYVEMTDEDILKLLEKQIARASSKMFQNQEIKRLIYRSLDDFNIGTPIDLENIKR